jgi:hypothetical protein
MTNTNDHKKGPIAGANPRSHEVVGNFRKGVAIHRSLKRNGGSGSDTWN